MAAAILQNAHAQPVLVVGAGPTGLAAAMSLARAHVRVRLIDRAREPAAHTRAIGIQARTLELFEQHRIVESFLDLGHRLRAANLYSNGHRLARLDFDPLQTRYPYLLCLDQSITERLLTEHLAAFDVQIERGVELVRCRQGAAHVEASLVHADGREETAYAPFVVAADGAHSTLRHLLGLKFEGKTLEQRFLLADLRADSDLAEDEFHLFASGEGLAGLFPMGDGRHRFIADDPGALDAAYRREAPQAQDATDESNGLGTHGHPDGTAPLDNEYALALCRLAAARRAHHPLALSALGWCSMFQVNSRMVERLRAERVFLVGDAAHIHSPAGAQGMNTGIQEALNLGWKIARVLGHGAPDRLLDTYHAERHPIERDVLRQTAFIMQMAEAERGPLKLLRERAMPILAAFGPLRDAARSIVSELSIQYRRSPLTLERVLDGGPRAGERAPDAVVHVLDGPLGRAPGTCRVYDLHDPACFSLFILMRLPSGTETLLDATGALAAPPLPADADLDRLGTALEAALPGSVRIWRVTDARADGGPTLAEAYGRARPGFYLVRPDGYIGARGRPNSDLSALVRHCESWFGAARVELPR